MMQFDKIKIVFIIVSIVFVVLLTIVFVALDNAYMGRLSIPTNNDTPGSTDIFNQGIRISIMQMIKATDNCGVASINYLNNTRQLVDINCVRQILRERNITLGR